MKATELHLHNLKIRNLQMPHETWILIHSTRIQDKENVETRQ